MAWKPVGCEKCKKLGYFGRTGIFEFWQLDGTDYEMILSHRNEHDMRDHLASREHPSLLVNGFAKVNGGVTSIEELRRMSGGVIPALQGIEQAH